MNEAGYPPDHIEVQLAHSDKNSTVGRTTMLATCRSAGSCCKNGPTCSTDSWRGEDHSDWEGGMILRKYGGKSRLAEAYHRHLYPSTALVRAKEADRPLPAHGNTSPTKTPPGRLSRATFMLHCVPFGSIRSSATRKM